MIQFQSREARPGENYVVNGLRCGYLSFAAGDSAHQELICGGGESPAAALAAAESLVNKYGQEALRVQQQAKFGKPATPGTEDAVFYTFGLTPVFESL